MHAALNPLPRLNVTDDCSCAALWQVWMSEDEREVLAIEQALAKARKAREKVAKKEAGRARAEVGVHVVKRTRSRERLDTQKSQECGLMARWLLGAAAAPTSV